MITKLLIDAISTQLTDAILYKKTTHKKIALTIDDVGDDSTRLILDAITKHNNLASQKVTATFFITASYLYREDTLLSDIVSKGHEIGNHGVYDHSHAQLSPEEFATEIQQAHEILTEKTDAPIRWFRPAQGFYNQSMLVSLEKMAIQYNYYPKFVLASMIPLDTYSLTRNPQFTFNYILPFIFPGSILIMHGGTTERAQNTAQTLPLLLNHLNQLAYQTVSLGDLWAS